MDAWMTLGGLVFIMCLVIALSVIGKRNFDEDQERDDDL